MERRGQIGVFVIIAIVIVAIVIVFVLMRDVRLPGTEERETPQQFFSSCMESAVKPIVAEIADQGGYRNPEGFIVYNETKIPYLCYTSEYFKPCIIQQHDPLGNFEHVLNEVLALEAERCASEFESAFEARGYSVSRADTKVNVSFAPRQLLLEIAAPMTLSRDVSRTYKTFELSYKSEYYELLAIATSILDFESTYGDSETTTYMRYYPDLTIQKTKLSDGSKIYTLSNVVTNERFTFATRSLALAAGYLTQ